MRELTAKETELVGGGVGVCTPSNSYYGVSQPSRLGADLINIYEGMVAAASHIFERVGKAL